MLRINVVLVNGKLVGKTVSDRWNLETIGYSGTRVQTTADARRLAQSLDCMLVVHKADQTISAAPTKTERESLGQRLARKFRFVA